MWWRLLIENTHIHTCMETCHTPLKGYHMGGKKWSSLSHIISQRPKTCTGKPLLAHLKAQPIANSDTVQYNSHWPSVATKHWNISGQNWDVL
jgi:hypothetical protein